MKKLFFVFAAGAALAAGVWAQDVSDPVPETYFSANPGKIGEKFTIFFAGNRDDFEGLQQSLLIWNNRIVQTLKSFLEQHPEYDIKVRGGTNGTLKGLDRRRIDVASKILSFIGIPASRIRGIRSTESLDWVASIGGNNGWMNRRVDFELVLND